MSLQHLQEAVVKYYIYISDAKVDMLFPQVPHEIKKKVATELGIDFKLLKATRKAESELEENRITRLEAVVSFIRGYGNLGTLEQPDEYFEGTASMWVSFYKTMPDHDDVVYWASDSHQTLLGLAGSSRHMFGGKKGEYGVIYYGGMIEEALKSEFRASTEQPAEEIVKSKVADSALKIVEQMAEGFRAEGHPRFEFMAKRLAYAPRYETRRGLARRVIFGSPLYVASAD